MKQVTNNEGRKVMVSQSAYNEMQSDYNSGVWMVIVRDIKGSIHNVILPHNFS